MIPMLRWVVLALLWRSGRGTFRHGLADAGPLDALADAEPLDAHADAGPLDALADAVPPDANARAGGAACAPWKGRSDVSACAPAAIIIGGQKCGTTALLEWLDAHPALRGPGEGSRLVHEMHYFDRRAKRTRLFSANSSWDDYLSYFRRPAAGPSTLAIEKTPNYMSDPVAAHELRATLPGARVVALLRDPAKRAYSAFWHNCRNKHWALASGDGAAFGSLEWRVEHVAKAERPECTAELYEAYLERRDASAGLDGAALAGVPTLAKSLYALHLARYTHLFGCDALYLVLSEEFYARPAAVANDVARWLGLPPHRYRVARARNARGYAELCDGGRSSGPSKSAVEPEYPPPTPRTRDILAARLAPTAAALRAAFPQLLDPDRWARHPDRQTIVDAGRQCGASPGLFTTADERAARQEIAGDCAGTNKTSAPSRKNHRGSGV